MIEPVKKEKKEEKSISFQGWPLGENTSVPPFQLENEELASCIDLKFNPGGQLETRLPVIKHTEDAKTTWRDIKSCTLSGTQYTICSDTTKIWYLGTITSGTGVTPVEIGSVNGPADIQAYNDVAIISDGSYLKYCDDVSEVKMAYDRGPTGTQFDNFSGSQDGVTPLTTAGVGVTFTTDNWDAGFTMPETKVTFHGVQPGTAATAISTIDFYKVSGGTTVASVVFNEKVWTTAADYINVSFTASDITNELEPNKEYYALIKGINFDLTHTDVASGGQLITGGSTPDTTKNPIMRVHPGVPPKSDFAVVSGNRLWVRDPDDPGRAKFGFLSHLIWSGVDQAGFIGVVDDNRNSFPIGAFADLYGTIYVYGTEDHPFICKLIGDIPSEYKLPLLFQKSWSSNRTLVNTTNDLWAGSREGVNPITGVQEFGDLRTFSAADPIIDRFSNWDTATAFAGYNAEDGQYWLYMPGFDYVSISHTKQPVRDRKGEIRYPWARYSLPITPSCFAQVGDIFMIGSTDGYIYKLDPTEYKDLATTQILPSYKITYTNFPFSTSDLMQFQLLGSSLFGSRMDIKIYKNGSASTVTLSKELLLAMSDSVTIGELSGVTIEDLLDILIVPDGNPLYFDININCYSFQIEVSGIQISGAPVFFNGMVLKYRRLKA